MRMTYQLGLPLVELDALLRFMKEITNIVLLFLFHYIQTHAYIIHTSTRHTQNVQTLYTHVHKHRPHIGCTQVNITSLVKWSCRRDGSAFTWCYKVLAEKKIVL